MNRLGILIFTIIILSACGSDKSKCSETRALDIKPSEGIGPYKLGMSEEELISILCAGFIKKEEESWISGKKTTYYFLENMSFIFRHDKLQEINVWGSFTGSFEDIDVDYDRELLETYGDVVEYKGAYRILDEPHIEFGKEDSDEGNYIKIFR